MCTYVSFTHCRAACSSPAALCAYGTSADPDTESGVGGCSHRRKKGREPRHIWPLQSFEHAQPQYMCVFVSGEERRTMAVLELATGLKLKAIMIH